MNKHTHFEMKTQIRESLRRRRQFGKRLPISTPRVAKVPPQRDHRSLAQLPPLFSLSQQRRLALGI